MRKPRSIKAFGPNALLLEWEQRIDPAIHQGVISYAAALQQMPGVTECVPAYASLLVRFDGTASHWWDRLFTLQVGALDLDSGTVHRIPVCYGAKYGPDLAEVAAENELSEEEVIRIYGEPAYRVYMMGFRPGFPFMGQLDERIATPRKDRPRQRVPAGSVGLAGHQTGIYPEESPGGWQLIGYCPLKLIDEHGRARFQPGDRAKFYAITVDELEEVKRSDQWGMK